MQDRLRALALLALPLVLLTGCTTPKPPFTAARAPGLTVQQITDDYGDGSKAIVEVNVAGLLKVGNPIDPLTDQTQWVAVAACDSKNQIALAVIRTSDYIPRIKNGVKQHQYQHLLTKRQCAGF